MYEVIVIGGGIGGLTAAAVLARHGVNVCLLERQSYAGGCAAQVVHAGYQFEPTHGLYCGWEPGGVYDRLFNELAAAAPRAQLLSPAYVVRLPGKIDVRRTANVSEFEADLRDAFPECAEAAIDFYRNVGNAAKTDLIASHLSRCPLRFRRFIDVQLQSLLQCSSDQCSYELAARAIDPRRSFWRIEGGLQSLIDALVESFKRSGGRLRLDSPVLRLAYAADETPIGVDLLSGERVIATRAIISNLTVWDTFGKLVGPARTPRKISSQLKTLHAWGAYQMFFTLGEPALSRLPAERILMLTDVRAEGTYDPEDAQLVFSVASSRLDDSADGWRTNDRRTGVLSLYTRVEDWFSFHEDNAAHEERDQSMLEQVWSRLHAALPELGDAIELIETATPRTFYEATRRRFGTIGRPTVFSAAAGSSTAGSNTAGSAASGAAGSDAAPAGSAGPVFRSPGSSIPNLWLVGDTVSDGVGLEGVVESAWHTALQIVS